MLRVVLVYIIKHLWNMWKARGHLGVLSTLHNGSCKNLCKFHIFFCCQKCAVNLTILNGSPPYDIHGDRREAKVTKYKERGKIQLFTSISHEKETDKRVD
jgi:hypothetical protein